MAEMGERKSSGETTRLNRASKPRLRVASVEFAPTPGVEQRLGRVYELLFKHYVEENQATRKDKPISQEKVEEGQKRNGQTTKLRGHTL